MTIREILEQAREFLEELGVETPRLDASVLLGEALGISREKLYLRINDPISEEGVSKFQGFLKARKQGLPVSYIRKKKEFWGMDFYVDNRVLVPRPDTEILVEEVLKSVSVRKPLPRIHDLCTGTGCIPIALKKEWPQLQISASDLSPDVKEVFLENCKTLLTAPIPFTISDLFEKIEGTFDIITANPPYINRIEYEEMKSRNWPEPEMALLGGEDGLDIIRRLIQEAREYLAARGEIFIESAFDTMEKLYYTLNQNGFSNIRVIKDLGGKDRVICGRKDD